MREARNQGAPLALARDRALWLVASDGTDRRLVTDDVPVARPIWSPDRSCVAFVSSNPADGRAAGVLYVVAAHGADLQDVYRLAHPNAVPSWSPDGGSIALTSVLEWDPRREEGLLTVRVVDVASGRDEAISSVTGGHGTSPAWSPDGRFVAFIGRPVRAAGLSPLQGPSEGFVWASDDDSTRSLTGDRAPGSNRVIWSPDADRLLVLAHALGTPGEPGGSGATILDVDLATGAIGEITGPIATSSASWAPARSPDGTWLARVESPGDVVLRDRAGNVTIVPVDRFLAGSISWSPGGESLIAVAGDPSQPALRIDGIGRGAPSLLDVDLPYDGQWPTGAPQWGPPWPGAAPVPVTIAGTGLDAEAS